MNSDYTDQILEEARVKDLDRPEKDHLMLVTDPDEVAYILDSVGVNFDNDSIIREDGFGSVFVDTDGGEYGEVWASHYHTPHLSHRVYRFR